ncbi:uncharacterized protein EI90DRAFT_3024602 [Cantharellus anzutake]|uniref:uncharacterized protein n=1 Tax=Cantharellus anzutake TaxID=1750568 RepID=UPI0019078B69|nr:uncharacterized protein EI90DRAFT_3024602 [Cantharellus anzutake]KAF8310133.1 hypothetical protein EI90DRAFT_3024602 [Cantharellus anzutake]
MWPVFEEPQLRGMPHHHGLLTVGLRVDRIIPDDPEFSIPDAGLGLGCQGVGIRYRDSPSATVKPVKGGDDNRSGTGFRLQRLVLLGSVQPVFKYNGMNGIKSPDLTEIAGRVKKKRKQTKSVGEGRPCTAVRKDKRDKERLVGP